MKGEDRAQKLFEQEFEGRPELIVRAPGRVNLIGDHTDYNDGFVLPMAIDRSTWIAHRPRSDRMISVVSEGHGAARIDLDKLGDPDTPSWARYIEGIAWALQPHSRYGWDGAIASDIPIGAGLASSAALELAAARAFSLINGSQWDPVSVAKVAQRGENEWVGVPCGIMDQMTSALGVDDHALLIDCRSLTVSPCSLPAEASVIVLDTSTRRRLVESRYEQRRNECKRAARAYGVAALRDLSPTDLDHPPPGIDILAMQRVRHVVTENVRAIEAARSLASRDLARFGQLMMESHASLRDDYEVSSVELDAMVQAASAAPGCIGARITGAGFGGCAVALVATDKVEAFVPDVIRRYRQATGLLPLAYVCRAAGGASGSRLHRR